MPEIGVMIQEKVRKKKKACFNAHSQFSQSKLMGVNKMWSLKILAMLKSESRTSLYEVQHN